MIIAAQHEKPKWNIIDDNDVDDKPLDRRFRFLLFLNPGRVYNSALTISMSSKIAASILNSYISTSRLKQFLE